jgi:CubicO group peptidase (beta-lactamase class C family)
MKGTILPLLFVLFCRSLTVHAQHFDAAKLDATRREHNIPELGYAVVTPEGIKDMNLCGYHKLNGTAADTAKPDDYFHLGSNTKAITGFIAATLVEQGLISWDTKFFSLFPGWLETSNKVYKNITLQDLLSHRAYVQPFSEGAEYNKLPKFSGNKSERRKAFAKYLLEQPPVLLKQNATYSYSNAGYSVAALMMEKVSGKTWEELVQQTLHGKLKLRYSLGWPKGDAPIGHWMENNVLVPVPPDGSYNLALAEPAGDISMPLRDYAEFIHLNLLGLQGKDTVLKAGTYQFLHYGLKDYAIGWANSVDGKGQKYSLHEGSAGTFTVLTQIVREGKLAVIIFANSGEAHDGMIALMVELAKAFK